MTDNVLNPPFVANPDNLRAGTPFVGQHTVAENAPTLQNDGWFPDVSLRDFRLRRQIDDSHADERLIDVLQQAMAQVNDELENWQCSHALLYSDLHKVPSAQLGGCSTKVLAYHRAVYSTAQAILNHRYWAVADSVGKLKANISSNRDSLIESADEYQRERWEALQQLRGEPRTLTGAL
jgi:hypothetical protein